MSTCIRLETLACVVLFALSQSGCTSATPPAGQDVPTAYEECGSPRPELCTQHYDPVCAQRDTGIRCVTTPCDSSEWRSYSNACVACADDAVHGYRPGDCADSKQN